MKIIPILLIALLVLGSYSTFNYAYAVDNNCMIIPIHIIQMPIPLGCIEQRLDALENATPSGADTTICGNQGTGTLIHITGTNCDAKALKGSADISITNSSNTITIDYNGTLATESTNCNNLGTGVPIHKVGSNCNAFSLIAGGSISITNTTDDYTIANTSPESTVCSNVGTGTIIHVTSSNCNAKTLKSGTGLSIANTTNDITYTNTYTCTSAGGTTLIKTSTTGSNCDLKGLTAGVLTTITSNTNDNTISSKEQFKMLNIIFPSITGTTKTNLPTVYTDIYIATFDQELLVADIPPCDNFTQFQLNYMVDFVGAGTDQYRWVDQANNANIFYEAPTISADSIANGAFITPPAWCNGSGHIIEMQGKSSNGTNDPVVYGYKIEVR